MSISVQHKHHTLANGLTVLGYINPKNHSAALGYFVRTGARDETVPEAGVSHFLEHMMFKGTVKRSAIDVTYHLGNIGAQANAFTSEENTVYYSAIVPQYFDELQELLSDMLRPALDPEEFATEKKVILEEIALYKDKPHFYLIEHALADYYGTHPAGKSVLGSTESISALTQKQMKGYFDRRYAANNITLVGAGNFDWDRFVRNAETYCAPWKPLECPRELTSHHAPQLNKVYRKKNIQQAHALFITGAPSAQDEERYAFSLLSMLLGDSTGSKLYWALVDTGLADSAGADSDERDHTGMFTVYASCVPEKMPQVTEIIEGVLAKPLDFTEDELERAKTKMCSRVVMSGDLPMGRLMAIGQEWSYRKEFYDLGATVQKIKSVTKIQIEDALNKFPLTEWSRFSLLPE